MKLLKTGLVIFLVVHMMLFPNINSMHVSASTLNLDAKDVEEFLDEVLQEKMDKFQAANATVSVVADGEVVLAKGYGYADLDERKPVDGEQTLFRIGSTSKVFTWVAVMQLVEQEKLDLDTDVNEYIDFEIPAKIESKQFSSEPKPITLRHLMSHTPGFEDYSSEIFTLSKDEMVSLDEYIRGSLPARVFPAGEVIAYSNYGTALAGYIVEQVSGMPFAEYIEQHIYTPLGMDYSTFRQPLPENLSQHMSKAYRFVDGEFREGKFELMPPAPAGSMSSTAFDMAQFMLALIQKGQYNGKKILEKATTEKMFSQLFSHHQELNGMAYGFIEGTFNEKRTILHPGSTMLYNTALYLLPEEQTGIFISHSGGSHLLNNEVFQAFMDRYFPLDNQDTQSLTPPEGALERSKEFTGEYQQNRKSFTTDDKFLSLMMGVIRVDVDDEGYLVVTHLGEKNRFIEVEQGVYENLREERTQDPVSEFQTIVFGTDPFGETMLMTEGPMSYSKATWYETAGFNILLIALSILIIIGSLLYWGIKSIIQRFRGKKRKTHKPAVIAKWVAIVYGLFTIVFLLVFMSGGEPDPVYQLPADAYGEEPEWTTYFIWMPYMMGIMSLGIVILTVMSWWKRFWQIPGRIHYTIFAGATIGLLWIFIYWNVF